MANSKNDKAWLQLFEKHRIAEKIEQQGSFLISSTTINEFREARLMTKFDYKSQLPQVFAKYNISILPTARGSYILSNMETFKVFENNKIAITKIDFPDFLESLNYNNITSESTALNCAYVSGIIQDFIGDEALKPTVNGRMGSSSFQFQINSKKGILPIQVENAQLEIDAGYEGRDALHLVEAKNSLSKDFLIRQVFYPFKLWSNKINKPIRNLFLTYTNGIFHFREYQFEDPNHYNSLYLLREKKYMLREGVITRELIKRLLKETRIVQEPEIPFPQADSFERLINLCELLNKSGVLSREEITSNYDFDQRQTRYYTDAGRYLGLISKMKEEGEV